MIRRSASRREAATTSQVALVTGASGGLGLATCLELAARGWHVWAAVRRAESVPAVEQAAESGQLRDRVQAVLLDVTDADRVRDVVATVTAAAGHAPDAVVANAGYGVLGFVEELELDVWHAAFATNFFGALHLVRAALPGMRARGAGRVLLVSSNAANIPMPGFAAYAATKWALEALAEAASLEVEGFGVEVCVVQPGSTRTGFGSNLVASVDAGGPYGAVLTRLGTGFKRMERCGRDSDQAASAIADLLERRHPPLRTQVGYDASLGALTKRVLPGRARQAVARRFYGLPGRGPS
jgi:NAD(P)-dependent dehydrogenase (short-subunit alcohol dehydrogenase family)